MAEARKMRIMVNKAGGTAGPEAFNYRVSLPSKWIKIMGLSIDERNVILEFNGEDIVLRKDDTQG